MKALKWMEAEILIGPMTFTGGGPFLSDSKALGYTWKCQEIPKISGKAWEIHVNPGNPREIPGKSPGIFCNFPGNKSLARPLSTYAFDLFLFSLCRARRETKASPNFHSFGLNLQYTWKLTRFSFLFSRFKVPKDANYDLEEADSF